MPEEDSQIALLEAELAQLKREAEQELSPEAPTPSPQPAVDAHGVLLNVSVPIEVGSVVRWRPAKKPWYLRDPERAVWGTSRRHGPRIGG
jgi:hypothetical protein